MDWEPCNCFRIGEICSNLGVRVMSLATKVEKLNMVSPLIVQVHVHVIQFLPKIRVQYALKLSLTCILME